MELITQIIEMNKLFDSGDAIKDLMLFIEFCSAILLIVVSVILVIVEKNKTRKNWFLYGAFIDVSLTIISDTIANYVRYPLSFGYFSVRISNHILFIANFMATWFVIYYIYEMIKENGVVPNKKWLYATNIIAVFANIVILSNIFTEKIFYFDSENIYYRGEWFMFSFIGPAVSLLLLIIMLIVYRKHLLKSELIVIAAYIALPIVAQIIQIFVYGFSWLQLSMVFSAFLLLAEHFINKMQNSVSYHSEIVGEGKQVQRNMIILVCVAILLFFGFSSRIAISFVSKQIDEESFGHYSTLNERISEEINSFIRKDVQIILDQRGFMKISEISDFNDISVLLCRLNDSKFFQENPEVYDICYLDVDGNFISARGVEHNKEDGHAQQEFYDYAIEQEGTYISSPYMDEELKQYVVTLSVCIRDGAGEVTGVLFMDTVVDSILKDIYSLNIPENSYVFVVNEDMVVDTHINTNYISKELKDISDGYEKLENFIKAGNYRNSIEIVDYDGTTRYFFINKAEFSNWYILTAIEGDIVNAARKNMSESIFLSLIICLIIGIMFTLWGSNNIVRQLVSAKEEAFAANEAKSRFLANMSHEIRTPINAVLGMDEIILRECKDEKIKDYASNIQSAGQSLLGIINDILDFSKIESGKMDIVTTSYNTADLVRGCINLIKLKANEKELNLVIKQADYIPKTLSGDEIRLRQIISNLLSNAVKYTHKGTVTFSVDWDKNSNNLIFKVVDTGIGIKPENIDDLFASFKRLEEKKNRTIEGTGLGLVITKQLVELMNGEINVVSQYGEGSTFTVTIPQQVIDSANTGDFTKKDEKSTRENRKKFKATDVKVLVVDDVLMNLMVMQGLLNQSGANVDICESGKQAIELIDNNKYDIIFLDHMMPEMDGMETFHILKEEHADNLGNTPIIMLTANAVTGAEEEYMREGFSGYLSKPIDVSALYDCIIKFVSADKITYL